MNFKDYYAVLGVKPDTPTPEMKRAFRKLARQYHPDVSKLPDAENKFKEINEAWEVLQDPAKKAQYDEILKGGGPDNRPHPTQTDQDFYQRPYRQNHTSTQQPDFSEFFNSIFGNKGEYGQTPTDLRGQDLHATLRIPLQLAYQGGTQTLTLQLGKNLGPKTLKVKIPAGVTDKSQIRLKNQGQIGGGGANGDLYIEVQIEPHPFYSLHHKDIHLKLPITPWEAALGANLPIPTLGGSVHLKIPPNSQSEQKLRLKGRGLPGQPPGDQYVILQLVLPKADTAQAQTLYQTMAKELDFNPREKLGV